MLKITKKIQFSSDENKMNSIANTKIARDLYYSTKSQNVKFLLEKRFSWMNEYIKIPSNTKASLYNFSFFKDMF